jgi:hypothetical protein
MPDGDISVRLTFLESQRRLWGLASSIGLTRDERIEFAEMVLKRDVSSWSTLDVDEMRKLGDYLHGFELCFALLRQRPTVVVCDETASTRPSNGMTTGSGTAPLRAR